MRIAACLPLLLWAAGETRADYVKSAVTMGGYLVDVEDGTDDDGLYQQGRINLGAEKGPVGVDFSYSRSDFHEKRPNTYKNLNRLALANVRYATPLPGLRLKVGRDFMPLADRSLYYDGGLARLQYKGMVQADLFGGFGVPSVYEEDLVDLDRDRALVGGKVTYAPINALTLYADGLVNGIADEGSLALGLQAAPHEKVSLSGSSVLQLDSTSFSHADVSALLRVRENDEVQVRFGYEDDRIDSSRYYYHFVNESHQFVSGGYLLYLGRNLNVNLDYGLLFYEDVTAHSIDLRVRAYGLFFGLGKEWETVTEALNLRAGYEALYWNRLRIGLDGVYSTYDLQERKLDLTAFDFSFRPGLLLGKGFEVSLGYEFLHNRIYESDHRFFAGIKHVFFKGLSK